MGYINGVRIRRAKEAEMDEIITPETGYRRLAAGILLQWCDDFISFGRSKFCFAGWMLSGYFETLCAAAEIGSTPVECCAHLMQQRPPLNDNYTGCEKIKRDGRTYYADFVDGYCVLIRDGFGHRFQPFVWRKTRTGLEKETPDISHSGFKVRWNDSWFLEVI